MLRSQTLYYVYSAYLITELIAPSIASVTMEIHLWMPFAIGIGSLLMCYLVLFCMPQSRLTSRRSTLQAKTDPDRLDRQVDDNSSNSNSTLVTDCSRSEDILSNDSRRLGRYSSLDSTLASFTFETKNLPSILQEKNTLFVLPIFFISTFRATTLNVLLQYTSVRFGWKLSRV